ncbi:MAG: VPLPA-CTERM sorting domain-containing protein [Rubrimonas sp.]
MIRSLLLASTALSVLTLSAARADCLADAVGLTCAANAVGPFTENRDGAIIAVEPGVTVTATNNTFSLRAADIAIFNQGVLASTSAGNNIRTIDVRAGGATVVNAGAITGSDRGIEVMDGPGFLTVINEAGAIITSRRQTIRALEPFTAVAVFNDGLISSANGRAAQLRAAGSSVVNNGEMRGGEEVIEAREDFTLENNGLIALNNLSWDAATRTWTDTGATIDEDGVQFASGTVHNRGVILSTDDGIDLDEGLVHNHKTGVIISAGADDIRDSAAIDIDAQFEPSTGPADFHPAGPVTIINEGYMEGPRGIVTEFTSAAEITILNTGTIYGRSGVAIDMSPDQGDTFISLSGQSLILGDILFGTGGLNTLALGAFDEGAGVFGTVSARAGGTFDVLFDDGFLRGDILGFSFLDELFEIELKAGSDSFILSLVAPAGFTFDGLRYDADGFAAFLSGGSVAPVPLPAAGWLLLAGVGGLFAMRRRAA